MRNFDISSYERDKLPRAIRSVVLSCREIDVRKASDCNLYIMVVISGKVFHVEKHQYTRISLIKTPLPCILGLEARGTYPIFPT